LLPLPHVPYILALRENGVWLKANKIFTHFPFHIFSGRVWKFAASAK